MGRREGSQHPSYLSLGLQRSLRRRSYLSLGAQRGLTAPFVLEPWRPELFTSSFAFGALGRREGSHHPSYWSLGVRSSLRRRSHLGGPFGPFWSLLGQSWGPFGPSWGVLEALRAVGEGTGLPLAVLGPSWEPLAGLFPSPSPLRSLCRPSQAPLRALLGPSWGSLGPSWSFVGSQWGRLGTIFGTSWAVLGRSWPEKQRTLKTFKNLRKTNVFGLLRPSRGSS